MKCAVDRLSALIDGDLGARAANKLRAHLDGCASCQKAYRDLERLRGALKAEAAHPLEAGDEAAAWQALTARLDEKPRAIGQTIGWRRPAWVLAPALAAVALAISGGLWLRHRERTSALDDRLVAQAEDEFRRADAEYQGAIVKLRAVTDRARGAWPPAEVARYQQASRALEAATDQCRRLAEAHPADPDSEELLFAAYQKEISFYQNELLRGSVEEKR